jgi:hypothetical protein
MLFTISASWLVIIRIIHPMQPNTFKRINTSNVRLEVLMVAPKMII